MINVKSENGEVVLSIGATPDNSLVEMTYIIHALVEGIGKSVMGEQYDFDRFLANAVTSVKMVNTFSKVNTEEIAKEGI